MKANTFEKKLIDCIWFYYLIQPNGELTHLAKFLPAGDIRHADEDSSVNFARATESSGYYTDL